MSDSFRDQNIDLSSCDKEPIHIPGSIQPHGVLLALKDGIIVGASSNVIEFLGIFAKELLGQALTSFVNASTFEEIKNIQAKGIINQIGLIEILWDMKNVKIKFDGIVHQNKDGIIILELESLEQREIITPLNFYNIFRTAVTTIQNSSNLNDLSNKIVQMVRSFTGFDHVMLYQFDKDWNGHVISEDKNESRPTYLNHHFPAGDIPAQARQLYLLNWLRLIPDVNYQPITIDLKGISTPLDLSFSVLRSVSPLHIQYLKNMDVQASMSISIIKDGKLWGLIACHHAQALYLPYSIRTACTFLGQVFSIELVSKEQIQRNAAHLKLNISISKILEQMALKDNIAEGLLQDSESLLNLMDSHGVALSFENRLWLLGKTPDKNDVIALIGWMSKNRQKLFVSDCLFDEYPPAAAFKDLASGIISLSIPKPGNNYIIWFRPEFIRDLVWAGNPHKPVSEKGDGGIKLSPRDSFASWKQVLRLRSLSWDSIHLEAALQMHDIIANCILKKFELDQMRITNEVNKRTEKIDTENRELESFNKMMINREMVMIDLKNEVDLLLKELDRLPKYNVKEISDI